VEDRHASGGDSCRIIPESEDTGSGFSLKNLDRLDLVSIGLVAALLVAMAVVLALAPPAEKKAAVRRQVVVINPELDRKIKIAADILASDNPRAVLPMLEDLKAKYPYDGRVFMLLGDLKLRMQDPVAAMHYYRKGVDLNPDFLDKKTDLFQGRKVKGVLAEVEKVLADRPDKDVRKELLYMRRKVAGGCG